MTTGRGRSQVVCGVDIGSTNTKVIALDPRGVVVARGRRTTPRAAAGAAVDALALLAVIEEMILEICSGTYTVHAVCVAGVGEDGVLVDEGLSPITAALAWFDPLRVDVFAAMAPGLATYEHPVSPMMRHARSWDGVGRSSSPTPGVPDRGLP